MSYSCQDPLNKCVRGSTSYQFNIFRALLPIWLSFLLLQVSDKHRGLKTFTVYSCLWELPTLNHACSTMLWCLLVGSPTLVYLFYPAIDLSIFPWFRGIRAHSHTKPSERLNLGQIILFFSISHWLAILSVHNRLKNVPWIWATNASIFMLMLPVWKHGPRSHWPILLRKAVFQTVLNLRMVGYLLYWQLHDMLNGHSDSNSNSNKTSATICMNIHNKLNKELNITY